MTDVKCEDWECWNNRLGQCQAERISLQGGSCEQYVDHREVAPEYQEQYFIACCKEVNGEKLRYRLEERGKRMELLGLTVFTSDDTRWGTEKARFTEARTGIAIPIQEMEKSPEKEREIRERLAQQPDVTALPLYIREWNGLRPAEEEAAT